MRTKLNVGMERWTHEPLSAIQVISALKDCGMSVKDWKVEIAYYQQEGMVKEVKEATWVGEVEVMGSYQTVKSAINRAAQVLDQECIAVKFEDGEGELIGPMAEMWGEFEGAFFIE